MPLFLKIKVPDPFIPPDGYPFIHVKKSDGTSEYIIEGAEIIEGPIDQWQRF